MYALTRSSHSGPLLCACWLVAALSVGAAAPAEPPFLPASLAAPDNLLSNPSFEAVSDGRACSFDLAGSSLLLHPADEQALHGTRALLADLPAEGALEAAASQTVPACRGCVYELSAWVKVVADRGGEVRLALQMEGADRRVLAREQVALKGVQERWQRLAVRLRAPREAVAVTALAPAVHGGLRMYCDAVRLAVVAGPRRAVPEPVARDLSVARSEATWLQLRWSGPPGNYEVSYRHSTWPRDQWRTYGPVDGFTYCLVGLRWETTYEVRVRCLAAPHYDEQGQVVPPPPQAQAPPTRPLSATTEPWQERRAGALHFWPAVPLDTFPGGQTGPRIVSFEDFLYVIESYDNAVYVSKVRPADFAVLERRQLLPSPPAGQARQRACAACVLDGKLYVLCELSTVGQADQTPKPLLVTYDLQQGALLGEPLPLSSALALGASWQGGLHALRGQLWLAWTDRASAGGGTLGRLVLAPLLDNVTGELHLWPDAFARRLQGPAVAAFGDELAVAFSEGARAERPGYEPLSLVFFNGADFRGLRKVADLGRNGGPAAAQLGASLYLLYGSDATWATYAGHYRDLRLVTLGPGADSSETLTYLDDMKYNCSVDVTAHQEALYVVHEKLEQEPCAQLAAPRSYGTFIGRIDTGGPLAATPAAAATGAAAPPKVPLRTPPGAVHRTPAPRVAPPPRLP